MKLKPILSIIAAGTLMILLASLNFTPATAVVSPDMEEITVTVETQPDPLVCLDCHRSPNINTNEGVIASRAFCFDCHKKETTQKLTGTTAVSLQITEQTFNQNQPIHRYNACISCHADVARSPHRTETGSTCTNCHTPHSEGSANEPHLRVTCQACHFESRFVKLDPEDEKIKLSHTDYEGSPVSLADHTLSEPSDKDTCKKCHFKRNPVGAPAAVLPSKSGLCIICHAAPLKIGHPLFGLAGLVFAVGMLLMVGFWYKGSVKGEETSLHRKISLSSESIWQTLFSKQVFTLLKIFILDIVFQRRILKESVSRWSLHSLIFTAILLRFLLALFTSAGFFFNPDGEWMLALIDKNHWFTAFFNDLLGLFILLGIAWAIVKRFIVKPDHVVSEYQDTVALVLIGTLVLIGFVLEGARILVTQIGPDTAGYAFIGFGLSRILSVFPLDWASVYPLLWYAHGLASAAFIAYLPFGKMRHIFNTPLTYFIEAVDGVKNEKRV